MWKKVRLKVEVIKMNKYEKYRENFKKAIQEELNQPKKYKLEDCELMPEDDSEYVKEYLRKRGTEEDETDI